MPSTESSRRNLSKAKASLAYRPPRLWRSPRESQYIRSLIWQWLQSRPASETRHTYPPCPRYRSHRFKKGVCACGCERAIVDADGYYVDRRDRQSARKLAQKLGVSHTWVNRLVRQFRSDPARQERQERMFGPGTLEQLREEQAKRQGDFVRYRPRRIKRVQRPDPLRYELERQLRAVLKKQRDWKRDYGHLPGEET
jgi:hypothetical protein